MKITGPSGKEYQVFWRDHGWSYAIPVVYVETWHRFLWWEFRRRKKVWAQSVKSGYYAQMPYLTAKGMHRREIEEWFFQAVRDYEEYQASWSRPV